MLSADLICPLFNTSPNVDGVALFLHRFGRVLGALEALLKHPDCDEYVGEIVALSKAVPPPLDLIML
jgi:hypothetical protein